jgi:hypothetical protein
MSIAAIPVELIQSHLKDCDFCKGDPRLECDRLSRELWKWAKEHPDRVLQREAWEEA